MDNIRRTLPGERQRLIAWGQRMSARLIEIFLPDREAANVEAILHRHSRRFWRETLPGDQEKYSCIVQQRYTERLLGELDQCFASIPGFATIVSKLDAVLPALAEDESTELPASADLPPPNALERFFSRDRISTDEIYDDINDSLQIRPSYLLTVALSALIAGLGMRSGQTAVVIGAMIIAPLLGPTMGLALAATVGKRQLGMKAAATLTIGCLVAVLVGFLVGTFLTIDPTVPELLNRTVVHLADIALALACGAAGVLAFSRGSSLSLVGVMVAVALVPPLAATGIYAGAGYPVASGGAFFLFTVNLVCVNVAGIAMFLFQGLPSKSWRLTGGVMSLWVIMLAVLASMMTGHFVFGVAAVKSASAALFGTEPAS